MDLERLGFIDTERRQALMHIITPHEHRYAVAPVAKGDRRAQNDFFFSLGKHHALWMRACAFIGEAEHGGGGVEPRAQDEAVFVHIEDRSRCDA